MRSAIQLYTLRSLDEPLSATVERVGATAFDGVEFAGLGTESSGAVAAALDTADLTAAAAHVPMDALEDDFDATVETYRAVDCDHLVVPWLDPEHFESRDAVGETATWTSRAVRQPRGRRVRRGSVTNTMSRTSRSRHPTTAPGPRRACSERGPAQPSRETPFQ